MTQVVVIDARTVSLWQRLIGTYLLVFRGGFKFDRARVVGGGS